ncbi:MAG: phage tail fiber protein [Stellaceae bacterium]
MFARRTAENILQHITGYQVIFAEPTAYIALYTTAPTDDTGANAVEVAGGGYARVATTQGASGTWGAASTSTDPTTISNSGTTNAAITFPTATGNWGTIVAFGLYDAATGGNLLAWDWLGADAWQPCTISAASPGVFTAHAHGFAANAPVVFTNVFGGTAPTSSGGALGSNNVSLVVSPATDSFTLTTGGTAVATSTTGNGMVRQIVQQAVPSGVQPSFASGQMILQAA